MILLKIFFSFMFLVILGGTTILAVPQFFKFTYKNPRMVAFVCAAIILAAIMSCGLVFFF